MKRFFFGVLAACLAAAGIAHAQRLAKFNSTVDYALTVEKQTTVQVAEWWQPFVKANTEEGYCWDLNTIPLVDRPEIGDKAKILRVGGAGQLTQIVEIPPGKKTVWHGYGFEGEALFYVLSGRGQTEYKGMVGGLPSNKYTWKKNSLFAIPVDHQMQHTNLDPARPVRMLVVTGYAINLYPYIEESLRSGRQNPAEGPKSARVRCRPRPILVTTSTTCASIRWRCGKRAAIARRSSTCRRPSVTARTPTCTSFAHKHGNQPIFIILKGAGYDIWSEAKDLQAYEASVKAGTAHKAPYAVGTLCGVPGGPHWHQHFSTNAEPLRYLAIVPRGQYEEKLADTR
jgi:mannose-6-phosphate isomerase-like protein (cupin superfamily)